jgi:hypothetical protein
MRNELIIFGRSPFLNAVDLTRLSAFSTIGFNQFGRLFEPDFLFFYDEWYDGFLGNPTVFAPHWFKQDCIKYVPKPSDFPLSRRYQGSNICLGHRYFTVSVALNWAILEGFKRVYLVGIDHVETDERFTHHDGTPCQSRLTPQAHKKLKQYVYNCTQHIDIFQTNPAVKDGWELPFVHVEELYH